MTLCLPKADIIIVNYNSRNWLQICIEGLLAQTEQNFRVVIVDNSPNTGDVESLGALDYRITVKTMDRNEGFAKGCNIGVSFGTAPYVIMLNPDARPAPNWLENLLVCASKTGAAMVGSTQLNATDPKILDGVGDIYSPIGVAWRGGYRKPAHSLPPTGACFAPCAAAALYRREVFEAVGGFDERFFCYMEDVDIAYRIRLRGGVGIQCREAIVYHEGSVSSGERSPFVIYHGSRNRIWTFLKDTPPLLLVTMLPLNFIANLAFLLRSIFHKRFKLTLKASWDGYFGWSWISAERKLLARSRVVGSRGIAKAVTWSPIKVINRTPDVRPLEFNYDLKKFRYQSTKD